MLHSRNYTWRKFEPGKDYPTVHVTEDPVTWWVRRGKLPALDDRETVEAYAQLAHWLFELPGPSPITSRYVLSLCHLRPIKGGREVVRMFPGATHEFVFAACCPNHRGWGADVPNVLRPVNYVVQVRLRFDAAAVWVGERIARAFVDAAFAPEPAGVRGARQAFAAHVREWQDQAARIFRSDISGPAGN